MASVKIHCHEPEKFRRLTPVKKPEGQIETHFARAPWFLLETINRANGNISHHEYIRNPHWQAKTRKGFLVGKWLIGFKPDQVVLLKKKEGTATALLSEAGVELILFSDIAKKKAEGRLSGGEDKLLS